MHSHESQESTLQVGGAPLLTSLVLIGAFALILVLLLGGFSSERVVNEGTPVVQAEATAEVTAEVTETVVEVPTQAAEPQTVAAAMPVYSEADIAAGQQNYTAVCSACHGMDLHGVTGLGKSLIDSEFALGLTDEELLAFVIVGRMPWDPGNTTGIAMPARGNGMLTDEQLTQVIAYIRTQQAAAGHIPVPYQSGAAQAGASAQVPAVAQAETTEPTPTVEPTATPTQGASTEAAPAPTSSDPTTAPTERTGELGAHGSVYVPVSDQQLFALWCAGCHTAAGAESGNQAGLLSESEMVQSGSDQALYDFLTAPFSFPNTGEFVHPVFGDFAVMTEAQIRALIEYVQALPAGS